jgi:RimJ/RimL family protein N-acetyltransferase
MHPLKTAARPVSMQELRTDIARYDQVKRLLVGIFDRSKDLHIGFYRIDVDRRHRLATFNVLIGDKAYWGGRVVLETRAALLDYVFRRMNIEKAVGMPPARNFPSIFNYRAQGWRLEGILKAHRRSSLSGERYDQLQFGLTKEEWIALRASR